MYSHRQWSQTTFSIYSSIFHATTCFHLFSAVGLKKCIAYLCRLYTCIACDQDTNKDATQEEAIHEYFALHQRRGHNRHRCLVLSLRSFLETFRYLLLNHAWHRRLTHSHRLPFRYQPVGRLYCRNVSEALPVEGLFPRRRTLGPFQCVVSLRSCSVQVPLWWFSTVARNRGASVPATSQRDANHDRRWLQRGEVLLRPADCPSTRRPALALRQHLRGEDWTHHAASGRQVLMRCSDVGEMSIKPCRHIAKCGNLKIIISVYFHSCM